MWVERSVRCAFRCVVQGRGRTIRQWWIEAGDQTRAIAFSRSKTPSMNRTLSVTTAIFAALTSAAAIAQAPPAASATQPAPAAAAAPQAVPAKVALIAFEQAVFATNEGQRAVQDVQKKYEPKKAQIDTLASEVDSLKKQLQSAPATLSEEERATRTRNIDTKEKQLNAGCRGRPDGLQHRSAGGLWQGRAEGLGHYQELCSAEWFYAAAGREQPGEQCDVGTAIDRCDAGCGGGLQQELGGGSTATIGTFGQPSDDVGTADNAATERCAKINKVVSRCWKRENLVLLFLRLDTGTCGKTCGLRC